MKMHKIIERTPKDPQTMFKSLKTNTNRMKNEEWPKNDVEIDCSHDSMMILDIDLGIFKRKGSYSVLLVVIYNC